MRIIYAKIDLKTIDRRCAGAEVAIERMEKLKFAYKLNISKIFTIYVGLMLR